VLRASREQSILSPEGKQKRLITVGRNIMKDKSRQVIDTIRSNAEIEYDTDTIARVAWASITDPGDIEVGQLIEQRGAVAALEAALNPEIESVEGINLDRVRAGMGPRTSVKVAQSLRAAAEHDWLVITPLTKGWPTQCEVLGTAAPICLWVSGDGALLTHATLTFVGSSTPTRTGLARTRDLAAELSDQGWVIVGCGTPGVDACALQTGIALHREAIAVLPCGIDQLPTGASEAVLADVETSGALVSEFAPGTSPTSARRAARNTLVAALGAKTVVVEADVHSDATLIAEESRLLGRSVGIVPTVGDETSGCRQLRSWFGGRIVRTVADINRL
jgi:DNA processing protein